MQRRDFLISLGAGAFAATGIAACARQESTSQSNCSEETFRWKLATTWPPNFPGLGTGANDLADMIAAASGGRLTIQIYGGGELVPAFETFDAVSRGTVEMGHSASYYWKGKTQACQFFASIPFGMNAQEMNGWLYHGGGWDLWREVYAPFNIIPAPCGNSGVQMGGWFNREINSIDDLKGLNMRIPGLGAEVLRRAGGTPVSLPGGEIFTALQTGSIDASEWIGPYNDLAFGLYQAAKYYYYPGWHEPGSTLEALINKDAFEALPDDLQAIVLTCCRAVNDNMLAEYTAKNHEAIKVLVEEHGVELRRFPDAVLSRLKELAEEVLDAIAAGDALFKKVYDSYRTFRDQVAAWHAISEQTIYETR